MADRAVLSSNAVAARIAAMGIAHYTEHSPEEAAKAVEELAHVATGMDMGTWSRIASALLGCIARCARLETQPPETRDELGQCPECGRYNGQHESECSRKARGGE